MEATAVSLARSVLDGVLSSAGSAVADEVARLLGVPKEVEFIRNELEMMQSFLRMASAHPEATGRNDTVKTWVKQVRDLAYHVEDCLLDFALYAATSSSRVRSWLPGVLITRHRIAERIRDLKASVEELNQRNLRYHIFIDHPHRVEEQAMLPDHDVHLAELAFLESDIIGRKSDKDELTRVISGSNGALSVLSVWGMGGIGKSSLVRLVRNDPVLLDKFDCCAWVTVPHPLDSANEFSERLRKHLGVAKGQDVRGYLLEKRYVIIVDDLLSQEWEHIRQVLPFDNNKGSHVIVTTRYKDVAERCLHLANGHGQVYELKPLADAESKDLLCRKVPVSNKPSY